ncbi:MAG: leucine-rich repeat protein [Faecousia sp.]
MKKRILSLLLAFALLCGLLPISSVSVHAYSETDIVYPVEGGNIYFDKETGAITDCDNTVTSADIPAEIDGVAVTSIGNDAFSYCSSMTSVLIPDSVTSIGAWAFEYCSSLTSVTIPNGVTHIHSYAFKSCSSLTNMTIPSSVRSISNGVFNGCSHLTAIDVAEENNEYTSDNGVLFNNDKTELLTYPAGKTEAEYVIPEGVTIIVDYAFYGCDNLTCVIIPDSLTRIKYMTTETNLNNLAFRDCVNLTAIKATDESKVYVSENGVLFSKDKTALIAYPAGKTEAVFIISNGVTNIGDYAFSNCPSLTDVLVPDSVTSIGDAAFEKCSSLINITIPKSVTSIGYHAFYQTAIEKSNDHWTDDVLYIDNWLIDTKSDLAGEYTIREGTVGIADYAFQYMRNLTGVTIPNSVTSIGNGAFEYCSGLTSETIPDSVMYIGSFAFDGCSSLATVTIPDSITEIRHGTFWDCRSLTSVTIPNSVTSVGGYAFYNCTNLMSVTISESVMNIGYYAFENCSSLERVNVTNLKSFCNISFESYASNPLYYAHNLYINNNLAINIAIPECVTNVKSWAFIGCDCLTSVAIPNSVTSIDDSAFKGCSGLTSVTISDSVTSIGYGAFFGCSSLTNVAIPGSVTSMGEYVFGNCTGLKSVILSEGVQSISHAAFSGCSSLTSVTIPDSVTRIDDWAFYGTAIYNAEDQWIDEVLYIDGWLIEAKTDIAGEYSVLPGTVGIADSAFAGPTENYYGCRDLTGVTIPDSVLYICSAAFRRCSSLTSITIPDSITEIRDSTFWQCSSLTSVTIPNSVTEIGRCAFIGCKSLTSVTIPDRVISIGAEAFQACSSLTRVTIADSVTYIDDMAFFACNELSGAYFMGDAPELGGEVFQYFDEETWQETNIPGLTIYYIEGKVGWTSPTWNGYPTATWTPAHEHSYVDTVTSPTCTEKGFTTHTCAICGDSYIDTYIDALGHDFREWTQTKAPTCTEKGVEKRVCSRCEVPEMREMAALEHSYENGVCVRCGEKDPNMQPPVEFADVPKNAWYVGAVEYAVRNGLMNGVGDGQFDPEGSMTRAMLVTVLWRFEGEPEAGENPFSDVPNGQWYTDAVAWAAANGVVNGVGNNRFDPEGKITREQMATILYRYAEKKGIDTSKRAELGAFPDAKQVSAYAKDTMQWAVAEKIINGSDGKLLPQGDATRAQVATILMRFIENIVKE